MRYSLILALAACSLYAQSDRVGSISIGAKIGAPINEPSNSFFLGTTNTTQGRWTGGPTIEVQLPFRFSFEFDALYRNSRTNSNYSFTQFGATNPYTVAATQRSNSWDFPLMLKYHFHAGPLRPFIAGGVQLTHDSIDASYFYTCGGPAGTCLAAGGTALVFGQTNYTRDTTGPVAGAGVEFRTRYMSISPELRYSRPTNNSRDNRFTALVGFNFGLRK